MTIKAAVVKMFLRCIYTWDILKLKPSFKDFFEHFKFLHVLSYLTAQF